MRERSRPRLRKEIEKGGTETLVLVPLRVGWKMLPLRGPVADQLAIPGRRRSREMEYPGIDPSKPIDDICTVRGDLMADEKVFPHVFIHPFPELVLLFNRPSPVPDLPDLIRGLIDRLAEAWTGHNKDQKEHQQGNASLRIHGQIL